MLAEVRRKAFPTEEETRRALSVAEYVKKRVEELGFRAVLVGSVARGTNLRGKSDVDVFVLFPKTMGREELERTFFELVERLKIPYEIRYAEHPYVTLRLEIPVDLVPAYEIAFGEKPMSAVDRSPLHQRFLSERLNEKLRTEIRYLKAFMRGIGIYGAEIAIKGFSGYLCELLILYYGDFVSLLKAAAEWKPQIYIHFGNGGKHFDEPLVVVDPVDPDRNVAAAVSMTSLATFVWAAREFLRKPSLSFFFPETPDLKKEDLVRMIKHRNTTMLLLKFPYPEEASADNVWGELQRLERFIVRHLRLLGYNVRFHSSFTDENSYCYIFIEIDAYSPAFTEVRRGPSVFVRQHAERFVDKHRDDVYGPWIWGDRLYTEVFRERITPELVLEKILEQARKGSLGSHVREALDSHTIYRNERLVEGAKEAKDWLIRVLIRRPLWLPRE